MADWDDHMRKGWNGGISKNQGSSKTNVLPHILGLKDCNKSQNDAASDKWACKSKEANKPTMY